MAGPKTSHVYVGYNMRWCRSTNDLHTVGQRSQRTSYQWSHCIHICNFNYHTSACVTTCACASVRTRKFVYVCVCTHLISYVNTITNTIPRPRNSKSHTCTQTSRLKEHMAHLLSVQHLMVFGIVGTIRLYTSIIIIYFIYIPYCTAY